MRIISKRVLLSILIASAVLCNFTLSAFETTKISDSEWDTLWNSRLVKYSKFQFFAMWVFESSGKRQIEKYVPLIITKEGVFATNWISGEERWETIIIRWPEIKNVQHFTRQENKTRLKDFHAILANFDGHFAKTNFRPKTESVELELTNGNTIRFTPKQYNQKIKFLYDDLVKYSGMYSSADNN